MCDELMEMKCEADTTYAEFRKMFTDAVASLERIRMNPALMDDADRIERLIERLLRNRAGHLRSLNHEKSRHRAWKRRAIELGWRNGGNE